MPGDLLRAMEEAACSNSARTSGYGSTAPAWRADSIVSALRQRGISIKPSPLAGGVERPDEPGSCLGSARRPGLGLPDTQHSPAKNSIQLPARPRHEP